MPLLELLLQHKEFLIIVILLVIIFVGFSYVKVIHMQDESYRTDNATLKMNLETSNESIKALQTTIDQQNSAINQLKSAADARVQAHAVEIAAANSKADTYRQQALTILTLKSPTSDKCADANNLINSEILKNAKK